MEAVATFRSPVSVVNTSTPRLPDTARVQFCVPKSTPKIRMADDVNDMRTKLSRMVQSTPSPVLQCRPLHHLLHTPGRQIKKNKLQVP